MPITLITGAPGNGKSVRLLYLVEQRRQKENREVYYSGIRDLLLPWHLFGVDSPDPTEPHMTDPSNWPELPKGSIIVIDECQRLYRTRPVGSKVPDYVAALETHRHKGFDIYLVTQSPMLIDSNVRNLVETHEHMMRKFGTKWATVHAWKGVKTNCIVSRKDSQATEFRYPKEVYSWFKSAEVHTVRFNMPLKVKVFLALPLVLLVAVWFAWRGIQSAGKPVQQFGGGTSQGAQSAQGGLPPAGVANASPRARQAVAPADYAAQFKPRFEGLFHTAPRYDELTKPAAVPVPVGCVLYEGTGEDSFCITQQGSRFKPPLGFIKSFVRDGMFIDFQLGRGPSSDTPGRASSEGRTGTQRAD